LGAKRKNNRIDLPMGIKESSKKKFRRIVMWPALALIILLIYLKKKFRRIVMWSALTLIILLIFLSAYGAFLGAERTRNLVNSLPLSVYWLAFVLILIAGLVVFRRLVRVPALSLIHFGCVLILAGAMWGSDAGHKLQKKLFDIDKIPAGQMRIYEGHSDNRVILENREQVFLFSVKLEFQANLDNGIISEELRHEFEENEFPLSQHVTISVEEPGSTWLIINELKEYLVRKKELSLNIYDPIKELPFSVHLNDFRLEHYKPGSIVVYLPDDTTHRILVETGSEHNLGPEVGKVKIVRTFERFRLVMEDNQREAIDAPDGEPMPALEVIIERPDGSQLKRYVFEPSQGYMYQDNFQMSYLRIISDYISKLQIIENNKVVAEKDIEVNHPLHYGGYHFYQHSYDAEAGQYTVLAVTSDTGLALVYAGYLMLCIGVFWQLWLRRIFTGIKLKSE